MKVMFEEPGNECRFGDNERGHRSVIRFYFGRFVTEHKLNRVDTMGFIELQYGSLGHN